jgi:hypothetical protein
MKEDQGLCLTWHQKPSVVYTETCLGFLVSKGVHGFYLRVSINDDSKIRTG